MIKNQALLFVIALLLIPCASAILDSSSAVLDITFNMPVKFELEENGFLSSLEVKFVMLPIDDERQKIKFFNYNPLPEKIEQNTAVFLINEAEDIVLESNFVVETKADFVEISERILFPLQELDSSFYQYIVPSVRYDIDKDIEILAASLAEGKNDLFEVVVEISNWVNQNMDYDLSLVQKENLTASWVLKNRKGVCTEYTSLFVALMRSLGIPSREVSGIAFTDSDMFVEGWDFHSWAEVYFPNKGWVPFDPTYGQNGFLDAGHVKLGIDEEVGTNRNSFSWRGRGVKVMPGNTELEVKIVSVIESEKKSLLTVTKSFLEDIVSIGSYNILFVELKNNNPFYVSETMRVSNVEGLTFFSPQTKSVVVPPYDSITAPLVFKVNDLDEGFLYTFPLRFYMEKESFSSSFSASRNKVMIQEEDVLIFLDSDKKEYEKISCDYFDIVRKGEYLDLRCDSLGEGGLLCFDEQCETFGEYEELVLSIEKKNPGLFTKPLLFESSNTSAMTFISFLVIDKASLDLSGTKHTKISSPKQEVFINISLQKDSFDNPKNISLNIKHPHFEENFFIEEISEELVLVYSFPSNMLRRKENSLLINAIFFDSLGKEYSSQKIININVEGLSLLDEVSFFFRRIYFWFANLW